MKKSHMIRTIAVMLVWALSTLAPFTAAQDTRWSNEVLGNTVVLQENDDGNISSSQTTQIGTRLDAYSGLSDSGDHLFHDETKPQPNIVNVSEPGAWALLILGVIGLVLARRKTRQ